MSVAPGLLTVGFGQMAWVTNDIDQAVALFKDRHDTGEFFIVRDLAAPLSGDRTARMNLALAHAGGIDIELIEPLGGDDQVWREILRGGDAFEMHFHHHAQMVSSRADLDRLKAEGIAQGFPVSVEGRTTEGPGFFYLDCRATLGHHVEYLYSVGRLSDSMAAAGKPDPVA
jgi:hypothetical protein